MSRILRKSPTSNRTIYVKKVTKILQKESVNFVESNKAIISKHATLETARREVNIKHAELPHTSWLRAVATKSFTKRLATGSAINAT